MTSSLKLYTVLLTSITIFSLNAGDNLLVNSGFELDITGRDYQPRAVNLENGRYLWYWYGKLGNQKCVAYSNDADTGKRSLELTGIVGGPLIIGTRMFHALPGRYTFSCKTKQLSGSPANLTVRVLSNPFTCGQNLKSFQKSFPVNSKSWTLNRFSFDLPPAKDNWRWLEISFKAAPGETILLDSLMVNSNEDAVYKPLDTVEMNLTLPAPWFKVYQQGHLPTLEINAFNSSGKTQSRKLELYICNFDNQVVFSKNLEIQVPAGSRMSKQLELELGKRQGTFRAELYYAGNGPVIDQQSFAVLPEIKNPVLATQNEINTPEMNKALGVAYGGQHNAGMWDRAEPSPGKFDWGYLDYSYSLQGTAYRENCQLMLWRYSKWSCAKKNKKRPFPPSAPSARQFDLEDYLNFIEKVCRRYPKFKYIQLWNEPWSWKPSEFVEFLKICSGKIKNINPDIKILAPTIFPRQYDWTEGFIKAGGLKYTDIFAVHAYPAGGGYIPETIASVIKWGHADGNLKRPIWNTETALHPYQVMSWYTFMIPANTGSWADRVYIPDAHTAEEGAERWVKMYLTQTAMGISRFFPHVAPHTQAILPRNAKIFQAEPDCSRYPQGIVWSVAGIRIGNATALGAKNINPNLRVMMFKKGTKLEAVIWTREYENLQIVDPIGAGLYRGYDDAMKNHRGIFRKIIPRKTYKYLLKLPSDTAEAFDMSGNKIKLDTENGLLAVPVSCRPVYLVVDKTREKQLCEILKQGRVVGFKDFNSQAGIGRTLKGKLGVLCKVDSCIGEDLTIKAKCRPLSSAFSLEKSSAKTRLRPGRSRVLGFELKKFPDCVSAAGGFDINLKSSGYKTRIKLSRIWLLGAFKRNDINIDGNLSEWDNIPGIRLDSPEQAAVQSVNWGGAKDSSAIIKAAWNEKYLYFAVSVTDDELLERRGWSGDCVELFFDFDLWGDKEVTGLDKDDFQIFANPPVAGKWPEGTMRANKNIKGAVLRARKQPYGYTAEIALPVNLFTGCGLVMRENQVIGFAPTLCDFDSQKKWSKLVWTGAAKVHMDTSKFGSMILLSKGSGVVSRTVDNIMAQWDFNNSRELAGIGISAVDAKVYNAGLDAETKSLAFDGRSSMVSVPDCPLYANKKLFQITVKSDAAGKKQLLWTEAIAPGWRYLGEIEADGKFSFSLLSINKVYWKLTSKNTIIDNKWHKIGYSWDASKGDIKLIADGKIVNQGKLKIEPTVTAFDFGGSTKLNRYFKGLIKRVRILNQ